MLASLYCDHREKLLESLPMSFFNIYFYNSQLCASMWGSYACEHRCRESPSAWFSLELELQAMVYEWFNMGALSQIWGLWKRSGCSQLLSHLSSSQLGVIFDITDGLIFNFVFQLIPLKYVYCIIFPTKIAYIRHSS